MGVLLLTSPHKILILTTTPGWEYFCGVKSSPGKFQHIIGSKSNIDSLGRVKKQFHCTCVTPPSGWRSSVPRETSSALNPSVNVRAWVSAWLSSLCGTLPKCPTSFSAQPGYWGAQNGCERLGSGRSRKYLEQPDLETQQRTDMYFTALQTPSRSLPSEPQHNPLFVNPSTGRWVLQMLGTSHPSPSVMLPWPTPWVHHHRLRMGASADG